MIKIKKIRATILTSYILFSIISYGYCSAPYPTPTGEGKNVAEKYKLHNTDKIIIKGKFSKNYFGIHDAVEFSNTIVEKNDISIILEGFRKSRVYDYFYNIKPYGELNFLEENSEVLSMGWFVFQGRLVFTVGEVYYTPNNYKYARFEEVFLKYFPPVASEGIKNFKMPNIEKR